MQQWAVAIAIVVCVSAAYSAGYVLLHHQRFPPPDANTTFVAFVGTSAAYRASAAIQAAAIFTLGVVVLATASRIRAGSSTPPKAHSFLAWLNSERATER